jgi:hypothetical protein
MTEIRLLKKQLGGEKGVRLALNSLNAEQSEPLTGGVKIDVDLEGLAAIATERLRNGDDKNQVDKDVAEQLHKAMKPVFSDKPHLLGEARFWEWLAVGPFKSYFVERWGPFSLDFPTSTDEIGSTDGKQKARLERAVLRPTSVKSQARHVVMRLHLYADTSFAFGGDYSKLKLLMELDQDVNSAIFERSLGLMPGLGVRLAERAEQINGEAKRLTRRRFIKNVNAAMSTLSVEYLLLMDPKELDRVLDGILKEVLAQQGE